MQLELQNIWRPAAAVLVLGWLLVLGLTASSDFNHLLAEPQLPENSIQASTKANASAPVNLDYSSIADMFLMGTVEETATPEIAVAELPETRLDLSLRGLFVSQGSELSGAVIETGDKQPSFFQIGALIPDEFSRPSAFKYRLSLASDGSSEVVSYSAVDLGDCVEVISTVGLDVLRVITEQAECLRGPEANSGD